MCACQCQRGGARPPNFRSRFPARVPLCLHACASPAPPRIAHSSHAHARAACKGGGEHAGRRSRSHALAHTRCLSLTRSVLTRRKRRTQAVEPRPRQRLHAQALGRKVGHDAAEHIVVCVEGEGGARKGGGERKRGGSVCESFPPTSESSPLSSTDHTPLSPPPPPCRKKQHTMIWLFSGSLHWHTHTQNTHILFSLLLTKHCTCRRSAPQPPSRAATLSPSPPRSPP